LGKVRNTPTAREILYKWQNLMAVRNTKLSHFTANIEGFSFDRFSFKMKKVLLDEKFRNILNEPVCAFLAEMTHVSKPLEVFTHEPLLIN
jgi:hypothetical protein